MGTRTQLPMRTEGEVRAALAALERHAPSADAVLHAVHDATRQHRSRLARTTRLAWTTRLARTPRWPQLVMGLAMAAAATGLAIALLPARAPTGIGNLPQRALPSAASVGKAMLTAFGAATGDVVYATQIAISRGVTVEVYQDWSWPAQPAPGQQARWRVVYAGRAATAKPIRVIEDDAFSYVAPRAGAVTAYGQLTVVCYAGTGQTGCGYGNTDTPAGTWSRHNGRFLNPDLAGTRIFSPPALAMGIVKGQWRVTRRTQVAGQQAIELAATAAGLIRPRPTVLWVNARTYLPLRMINGAGSSVVAQSDWHYLRPTSASLALLRAPIPAGYPRTR